MSENICDKNDPPKNIGWTKAVPENETPGNYQRTVPLFFCFQHNRQFIVFFFEIAMLAANIQQLLYVA